MTGGQARLINQGEKAYEFRMTDAFLIGLPAGPLALWFGVRGDHLYLTNDKRLLDEKVLGLSLANTAWGEPGEGAALLRGCRCGWGMAGCGDLDRGKCGWKQYPRGVGDERQ